MEQNNFYSIVNHSFMDGKLVNQGHKIFSNIVLRAVKRRIKRKSRSSDVWKITKSDKTT